MDLKKPFIKMFSTLTFFTILFSKCLFSYQSSVNENKSDTSKIFNSSDFKSKIEVLNGFNESISEKIIKELMSEIQDLSKNSDSVLETKKNNLYTLATGSKMKTDNSKENRHEEGYTIEQTTARANILDLAHSLEKNNDKKSSTNYLKAYPHQFKIQENDKVTEDSRKNITDVFDTNGIKSNLSSKSLKNLNITNERIIIPPNLETYLPKTNTVLNQNFKINTMQNEKSEEENDDSVSESVSGEIQPMVYKSSSVKTQLANKSKDKNGNFSIPINLESLLPPDTTHINENLRGENSTYLNSDRKINHKSNVKQNDTLKNGSSMSKVKVKNGIEDRKNVKSNSRFLDQRVEMEPFRPLSILGDMSSYQILGLLRDRLPNRERKMSPIENNKSDQSTREKEKSRKNNQHSLRSRMYRTLMGPLKALYTVAQSSSNMNELIRNPDDNHSYYLSRAKDNDLRTPDLIVNSTDKTQSMGSHINGDDSADADGNVVKNSINENSTKSSVHNLTDEIKKIKTETIQNIQDTMNNVTKIHENDTSVVTTEATEVITAIPIPLIPSSFITVNYQRTTQIPMFTPFTEYFTEIPGILPTISSEDYKNHRNSKNVQFSKTIEDNLYDSKTNYTKEQYEAIKAVNLDKIVDILMNKTEIQSLENESNPEPVKIGNYNKSEELIISTSVADTNENNESDIETKISTKPTITSFEMTESKTESTTSPTVMTTEKEINNLTNDEFKINLIKDIIREKIRSKLNYYEENNSIEEDIEDFNNNDTRINLIPKRRKRSLNNVENTNSIDSKEIDEWTYNSIDPESSEENVLLKSGHVHVTNDEENMNDINVQNNDTLSNLTNVLPNIERKSTVFDYFIDLFQVVQTLSSKCIANETIESEEDLIKCVRRIIQRTLERVVQSDEISLGFNLVLVKEEKGSPSVNSDRQIETTTSWWGWYSHLFRTLVQVFQTHRLRVQVAPETSERSITTGRHKHHYKKVFPLVVGSYMIISAFLIPLGFQFMAMLGGKALLLSKLALIMGSMGVFRKGAAGHYGGGWADWGGWPGAGGYGGFPVAHKKNGQVIDNQAYRG